MLRSVVPAPLRHILADAARALRGPDRGALRELRSTVRVLASVPPRRDAPTAIGRQQENAVAALIADGATRYADELAQLCAWARMRNERSWFPAGGMYDWIETQILYLLIRHVRPSTVVEISPNFGYSTGTILLALNANQHGELWSFDLDERYHRVASRTFRSAGIETSRQHFVTGDVRRSSAIPPAIDLLFMDSDHSYDFACWYLSELLPKVRRGGLVHVHDVLRHGVLPHQGDHGEGLALAEHLAVRKVDSTDYFYTSEFVRDQPLRGWPLSDLARYPFGDHDPRGTNSIEQNASFWMLVR